jgi:gliding motility-associated protein GldC
MENEKVVKTAQIIVNIDLNEENLPINIHWNASDAPTDGSKICKAVSLAFFDRIEKDTLRMDLWTKDMQIDEMDKFFFQMLYTMADTYNNSTKNHELANEMKNFALHFGKTTKVID